MPNRSILDSDLEGSYALCLIGSFNVIFSLQIFIIYWFSHFSSSILANLIQLSLLEVEVLVDHCEKFCVCIFRFFVINLFLESLYCLFSFVSRLSSQDYLIYWVDMLAKRNLISPVGIPSWDGFPSLWIISKRSFFCQIDVH